MTNNLAFDQNHNGPCSLQDLQGKNITLEEIRESTLQYIQSSASKPLWKFWVPQLQWVEWGIIDGQVVVILKAPNHFVANKIHRDYKALIEAGLHTILSSKSTIKIEVSEKSVVFEVNHESSEAPSGPLVANTVSLPLKPLAFNCNSVENFGGGRSGSSLYTFENYVVGENNVLAFRVASKVAAAGPRKYNPLFIHASSGLGKTHLLKAIQHQMRTVDPEFRVHYLSGEEFLTDAVDSMRNGKMSKFRSKFRKNCDCLLLDGIESVAGRTKTEDEFFHTFDALYSSGRQIVIASDLPPENVLDMTDRLRSRMKSGIVAGLGVPDFETRIRILKTKAKADDILLPDDVCRYLATIFIENVRDLEGILIRLEAQSTLFGQEISFELTKSIFGVSGRGSEPLVPRIIKTVALHFGINQEELKSRSKVKKVVNPRQVACYLLRKHSKLTFKEIAKEFGMKDHGSIIYNCRKISQDIAVKDEMKQTVLAIEKALGDIS